MADVTLADLVAWEPRLRPIASDGRPPDPRVADTLLDLWSEREVSWAVTARASTPMLPLLRGGELVILPTRALGDSGVSLPILLRELASLDAAGVVLDTAPQLPSPIPVLVADTLPADFETDLNRLLTQRRGELYRAATELGRLLSNLDAAGSRPEDVAAAASGALGVPVGVADARGATLAATDPAAIPGGVAAGAVNRGWRVDHLATPLPGGETLWFGPVPRASRAFCRVAAERIAVSVEASLVRAAQTRPRGPARAAALASVLVATSGDAARAATAAGLPADAWYRVALLGGSFDHAAALRLLAPFGTIHDAGTVDSCAAIVLETRLEHAPTSPATSLRQAASPGATSPDAWLAISSLGRDVSSLPAIAREARFVAGLLTLRRIPGPVARFDMIEDLGVYQALFPLWGASQLARFASDALGDLIAHDRRGTLRTTLLAFLECGGSHVDTARALEIHRNTLAYRLKQIADITRLDPLDPGVRITLHLALIATRLPALP